MNLLKRENLPLCLILTIFFPFIFVLVLASELKIFDDKAWYSKWYYWFFATICLIFPIFIMFIVFEVEMLAKVANKLKVPGSEIYNTPYTWILCLIVPIVGWIMIIVMLIYLNIWNFIKLCSKEGREYVK